MHNQIMHLIKGELIGKKVIVITPSKKIEGTIINETKHTFTIQKNEENRKALKKGNKFQFKQKDNILTISGELLLQAPEERIKIKNK